MRIKELFITNFLGIQEGKFLDRAQMNILVGYTNMGGRKPRQPTHHQPLH
ncbi:MAG: hypothetical protein QGH66_06375 [Dehalococcoidia bacterium]|jgi:hypothetical protein|nr:hypothetical protein [Dehalococcoidia bacterium]MDP7240160.1 hypothetical protein [Dehalococcoidia bacterium]